MKPTEMVYGKYVIRVGQLSGRWIARAFRRSSANLKGIAAEASGESPDEAVGALKQRLDNTAQALRSARRHEERSGFDVPSAQEYVAAIADAPLAVAHVAMLKAHAAAAENGLTAGELARAAGYADHSSANMHYGKCGRLLADVMNIRVPDSNRREGDVPTIVLAHEGNARPDGEFVWVMYPELRQAVEDVLA